MCNWLHDYSIIRVLSYTNVLCGPKSQHYTVSILTGTDFHPNIALCCFYKTSRNTFHCQYPTFHKSYYMFPRYELSKIGLVSFFFSFILFVKVWKLQYSTNVLFDSLEICCTERQCKGTSRYWVWYQKAKQKSRRKRLRILSSIRAIYSTKKQGNKGTAK